LGAPAFGHCSPFVGGSAADCGFGYGWKLTSSTNGAFRADAR
jgi:hypothetical protein